MTGFKEIKEASLKESIKGIREIKNEAVKNIRDIKKEAIGKIQLIKKKTA